MECKLKKIIKYAPILGILFPLTAYAADPSILNNASPSVFTNPSAFFNPSGGTLVAFISNAQNVLLILVSIAAVSLIVWSGAQMLTSGGDPEKIKKAKLTLTATIVGLLIVLAAAFIVNAVLTIFR